VAKYKSRREKGIPRARTLRKISRAELAAGGVLNPPVDIPRPRTRAECIDGVRPCPWVGCRYSLHLEVNPETGSLKLVFPTREPWEMPPAESCALDVADRGPHTLEQLGELLNVTRERSRQLELKAIHAVKAAITEAEKGTEP
jgi:hypothetical protein